MIKMSTIIVLSNYRNERIVRLVWMRLEIENAFSWLSTLGGAYSALGDYFEDCVSSLYFLQ